MTTLSALEVLAENSTLAVKAAQKARDARKDRGEREESAQESRQDGAAFAYSNSHRIMKAELQRLKNLFQNGALTIDSFTV